jgi:drug/metabolite transporter (DMT)-like permease
LSRPARLTWLVLETPAGLTVQNDVLLLLMVLIWGGNYSLIKAALTEIPPLGFNSLRLALASSLFLILLAVGRTLPRFARGSSIIDTSPSISRRDWAGIAALGVIGHFVYQLCYLGGLSRTSVANNSLIMGCSPVAVALLSAAVGHERVNRLHWVGAGLSVAGISFLVGRGASLSQSSLAGDLLSIGAVLCWAIYTVGSRVLLVRHSPLVVTGYSIAIGTALYVPLGLHDLRGLAWQAVSFGAWAGLVLSGVFALFVAYLIWYDAVQRIGNVRTSMYSNTVPIVAMLVAALWLGERLTPFKIVGATAVLIGVGLTRMAISAGASMPAEE